MRIFITGGTGYLGSALCRRWAAEGHEVRALVRPASERAELESLGVALFEGDVGDRYSMREGMSGAEWVVHAAAELDIEAPAGRLRATNVEGTANAASLAYKLGVGRFLSVSSMAYFGGSPADGTPAAEESPPQRPFPTHYSATKHEAELEVRRWAEQGLRVNTVYPSLVYGPPGRRRGINPLLRALAVGRLPALVGTERWISWIYLEDLVDGVCRVMERAAPGAAHLLAGEAAPLGRVAERVCELAAVAPPRLRLSPRLARGLLAVAGPLYRLRRRRPPLGDQQLRNLARHWRFDDSRARRELEWAPRGLEAGLPPTVEHLLAG